MKNAFNNTLGSLNINYNMLCKPNINIQNVLKH